MAYLSGSDPEAYWFESSPSHKMPTRANMQCKLCTNWFHECGNCDLEDWEREYCSQLCRDVDLALQMQETCGICHNHRPTHPWCYACEGTGYEPARQAV